MSSGKKALLAGVAITASYAVVAIVAYLIYGSVAYAAYNAESDKLERQYRARLDAIPGNKEKRDKLEAELDGRWETTKAEIDARREEALAPASREYWRRMERAKKKRDSSDMIARIQGSTEELEAQNAWTTDSRPIASRFSQEESNAREAYLRERRSALAEFDNQHPSEFFLISREYPSDSLLPSMSRDEFQKLLRLIGFAVLGVYIAYASFRAVRASSSPPPSKDSEA